MIVSCTSLGLAAFMRASKTREIPFKQILMIYKIRFLFATFQLAAFDSENNAMLPEVKWFQPKNILVKAQEGRGAADTPADLVDRRRCVDPIFVFMVFLADFFPRSSRTEKDRAQSIALG